MITKSLWYFCLLRSSGTFWRKPLLIEWNNLFVFCLLGYLEVQVIVGEGVNSPLLLMSFDHYLLLIYMYSLYIYILDYILCFICFAHKSFQLSNIFNTVDFLSYRCVFWCSWIYERYSYEAFASSFFCKVLMLT